MITPPGPMPFAPELSPGGPARDLLPPPGEFAALLERGDPAAAGATRDADARAVAAPPPAAVPIDGARALPISLPDQLDVSLPLAPALGGAGVTAPASPPSLEPSSGDPVAGASTPSLALTPAEAATDAARAEARAFAEAPWFQARPRDPSAAARPGAPPSPLAVVPEASPAIARASAGAVASAPASSPSADAPLAPTGEAKPNGASAAQRPPVAASANALAAPAAVLTLRPAAPEMPTAAAPIAKRAWRFPVQSRSPVAVALAELDAGLSVAIRATALDQAERARLRDSVAALLSRHGWPLARLSLLTPQRGERE